MRYTQIRPGSVMLSVILDTYMVDQTWIRYILDTQIKHGSARFCVTLNVHRSDLDKLYFVYTYH